ncbi:MAG: tyrosine-type recombinase/integrase [Oligoflexus sp.]
METIFFLPEAIASDEAKEVYRSQEIERTGRANPSHVDWAYAPHRIVREKSESLKTLLSKARRSTSVILWDLSQVTMGFSDLKRLLDEGRYHGIVVRSLNPPYLFDPKDDESMAVLSMLSKVEGKPRVHEKLNESGFGFKKADRDTVEKMRSDKERGLSLREIAAKYGYSRQTVSRYTRDIKAIYREQKKTISKSYHERFSFAKIETLPLAGERNRELVREFLKNQRSDLTRKNYFLDLKKYLEWAELTEKNVDLVDIKVSYGHEYLEYLKSHAYKPSVVNRYFQSLKSLLSYLEKRGYIQKSPFSTIKLNVISRNRVETKPIPIEDLKKILSLLTKKIDQSIGGEKKFIAYRNLMAVYLLSATGVRIGGLLGLRKCDVYSRYGSTILIVQDVKGQSSSYEDRLDDKTAKLLNAYVDKYFREESPESYLISHSYTDRSRPMNASAFDQMLKKILVKIGIKEKYTAHSFRVTAAINWYQAGLKERDIQLKLNHKNIGQTMAYLNLDLKPAENDWIPTEEDIFEVLKVPG